MAKFCIKCGTPFKGEEKFCTNCGAPRSVDAAPIQPSAPPPTAAPVQRAAPAPVQSPAPGTQPVQKNGKTGVSVGIGIGALVLIALVAVGLWYILGGSGKAEKPPRETRRVETVKPTEAPMSTPVPTGEPVVESSVPADAGPGIVDMTGVYYCAEAPQLSLELAINGSEMVILKTVGETVDILTSVEAPTGNSFSILYGGRSIDFLYSESAQSVTVVENGMANVYTMDGYLSWPDEEEDPFNDPDAYILPTDSRFIEESELYGMDAEQVKLARNEIYARYGYSFTMDKFRDYFRGKSWYRENASVNANTFGTAQMNDYERTNLDTIKNYETKMGW